MESLTIQLKHPDAMKRLQLLGKNNIKEEIDSPASQGELLSLKAFGNAGNFRLKRKFTAELSVYPDKSFIK